MSVPADHVSILLDIKQEIGSLIARMDEHAAATARLEEGQHEFRENLHPISTLMDSVAEIKPKVTELMDFKAKVSFYIWGAGVLVSGLLFFVWEGIKYAADKWFVH